MQQQGGQRQPIDTAGRAEVSAKWSRGVGGWEREGMEKVFLGQGKAEQREGMA